MSQLSSRVRADASKRRRRNRARLMSVYVAGATAYCAWAYPDERLLITSAAMSPEIVTLIEQLDANDAVYLEEGATEREEIDIAASFGAYLPDGMNSRRSRPAVPPSTRRALGVALLAAECVVDFGYHLKPPKEQGLFEHGSTKTRETVSVEYTWN